MNDCSVRKYDRTDEGGCITQPRRWLNCRLRSRIIAYNARSPPKGYLYIPQGGIVRFETF